MQPESSKSTGPSSLDGTMCEPSRPNPSPNGDATLFAGASPASLFRVRVDGKLRTIRVGSGRSLPVYSVFFDLDLPLLRTCRASSLAALPVSSLILPRSVTLRKGELCLHKSSGLRTFAGACLSLPTPVATEHCSNVGGSQGRVGKVRYTLIGMARYAKWPIPTPTVNDSRGGRNKTARRKNPASKHHDGMTLVDYVTMFPTPRASDSTGGPWKKALSRPEGCSLRDVIHGGPLNPTWVEWLMGFPAGWTDLDASGTP